jgi:hypothetical protein
MGVKGYSRLSEGNDTPNRRISPVDGEFKHKKRPVDENDNGEDDELATPKRRLLGDAPTEKGQLEIEAGKSTQRRNRF